MSTRTLFAATLSLLAFVGTTLGRPLTLEVDARDVTLGIQHVHLVVPVHAGALTLAYPKWIPGEHAADGPLTQLVALQLSAGIRSLSWRRDPLEPFSFKVDVPSGIDALDIRFDYLSPPRSFADGYGKTPNVTPHLLVLPFNHFVLYPAAALPEQLEIKAEVLLPADWKFDTALTPERVDGNRVSLPVTSLYTLIDSPLLAGEYFRSVPLGPDTRLSIAADSPADLALTESTIAGMRRLVQETRELFGAGHYRQYVWLVALGDNLDPNGLEHHESTDVRDAEGLFTDPQRVIEARTLPHEYVHSWNGKFRRPVGLATTNYQQPMVDDLLWVYEGLTRYLGDFVLRARSGLSTPEQIRDYVAWVAASMDVGRPGRAWRSLADTATALPGYADAPAEWGAIRRKRDYYDEMLLVWLEADTRIRQATHGAHSLDDFCRDFFGGPGGTPQVKPYSRGDLASALHRSAALDWEQLLHSRVDEINLRAPLDGIVASGWRLTYSDQPNSFLAAREKVDGADNLAFSLGVWVKRDGSVLDVVNGSPAFAAGVGPTMRLLAIQGHKWSAAAAREVIVQAERTATPLQLIVESADQVRVLSVDYHAGLRNPQLTRLSEKPDVLSQIIAPRAPPAK